MTSPLHFGLPIDEPTPRSPEVLNPLINASIEHGGNTITIQGRNYAEIISTMRKLASDNMGACVILGMAEDQLEDNGSLLDVLPVQYVFGGFSMFITKFD